MKQLLMSSPKFSNIQNEIQKLNKHETKFKPLRSTSTQDLSQSFTAQEPNQSFYVNKNENYSQSIVQQVSPVSMQQSMKSLGDNFQQSLSIINQSNTQIEHKFQVIAESRKVKKELEDKKKELQKKQKMKESQLKKENIKKWKEEKKQKLLETEFSEKSIKKENDKKYVCKPATFDDFRRSLPESLKQNIQKTQNYNQEIKDKKTVPFYERLYTSPQQAMRDNYSKSSFQQETAQDNINKAVIEQQNKLEPDNSIKQNLNILDIFSRKQLVAQIQNINKKMLVVFSDQQEPDKFSTQTGYALLHLLQDEKIIKFALSIKQIS